MNLLIAADMEGITGVVNWDQVTPGTAEYQRFRRLMTADVNAAVEGALAAGVEHVQVTDGHWAGANILIEELHPRARLNTGAPSPFAMVQGVQNGVDAALFIGYHARIGTRNAILDHTWSSKSLSNLWLNGRLTGETGLNAALCGAFDVPVLLVSGDQSVAAEASDWITGIETAVVKTASGRFTANCLPPDLSQRLIRISAERAVRRFAGGNGPQALKLAQPVTLRVEWVNTQMADMVALLPGASRLDGRTIEFLAADMPAAYCSFRAAVSMAN